MNKAIGQESPGVLSKSATTVLVVDDDETICDILKKLLLREGYRVMTAMDGETALQIAKKEKPRLAILDISMPEMDGISLLRQFQQQDHTMIVVMLTAYGCIETARKSMHLGAYDYITKPWDNQMVVSLVREALQEEPSELSGI